MAKIAAITLPLHQASQLVDYRDRMQRALCLYSGSYLECETYWGQTDVCLLVRIAPDPLSASRQPSVSGSIAGVACGYYLSPANARSDSAECLMRDLSKSGVDVLPCRDGVFAFAYWDKSSQSLVAGVDKLGMRPLYWTMLAGGGYAIASEVKALAVLLESLNTNWAAWEEQITFGFLFDDHTLIEGIQRFSPAETITFRGGRSRSRIVEQFLESIDIVDRPMEQFLDEQCATFDEAMTRLSGLYDADKQSMLTLSGGYDSRRALGWLLNKEIAPDIYTVPEVMDDGWECESAIVRELCTTAGLSGQSIYPRTSSEGAEVRAMRDLATDFESDEHDFSTILAMGLTCHDKVNYDGLAAGSQLSGAFMAPSFFKPGGNARFLARRRQSPPRWLSLQKPHGPPLHERMQARLESWGDNPNRFAFSMLLSRTRREISLAPLSIQANVFESLYPYLDRAMMRNALSFPPARKLDANIQMRLIERLHPALSRVPTAHDPHIADDERYRVYNGRAQRGARLATLENAYHARPGPGWSLDFAERLRFRVARLLLAAPGLVGDHRIRWELSKAAKVEQLAHFDTVIGSPDAYGAACQVLQGAYGARRHWCRAL